MTFNANMAFKFFFSFTIKIFNEANFLYIIMK